MVLISQRALCVVIKTAVTINTFQGSISQIKQHVLDVRNGHLGMYELLLRFQLPRTTHGRSPPHGISWKEVFSRKFNKCFHWWRHEMYFTTITHEL